MHSYQTLAVLALAVSTASPALSAPVLEQPRASVTGVLGGDIVKEVVNGLKQLGTGGLLGAAPAVAEHFLGGNSTRRALPRDTDTIPDDLLVGRAPAAGEGALLGETGIQEAHEFFDATGLRRREPLPIDFSKIESSVADVESEVKSILGLRGDATRREPLSINLSGIENSVAGVESEVKSLLGLGGDATRREPLPFDLSTVESSLAGVESKVKSLLGLQSDATPRDLIDALQLLSRRVYELD